jgi:hypothetical protein
VKRDGDAAAPGRDPQVRPEIVPARAAFRKHRQTETMRDDTVCKALRPDGAGIEGDKVVELV